MSTTTKKYTDAGVISAVCADICDKLAVRVHTGLVDYDEIEEKLLVVRNALAQLARQEGVPDDMIWSPPGKGVN